MTTPTRRATLPRAGERKRKAPLESERAFQTWVIDALRLYGWRYYFTWRSIHSPAGFPDLVAVRGARAIFAELKKQTGKVTPAQQEWLDALKGVPGVETYLWKPSDRTAILKVLA